MLKLFVTSGSCSFVPHSVARSLNLEMEVIFAPRNGEPGREDYLKINPVGAVPALILESGSVITQNAAIIDALVKRTPDAGLFEGPNSLIADPNTELYSHQLRWFSFCNSDFHPVFSGLFRPEVFTDDPSQYEAIKTKTVQRLFSLIDYANTELGTRPFLAGDQISYADVYFTVALRWAFLMGVNASTFPNVMRMCRAVQQHPVVMGVMAEHQIQSFVPV